jgi:hypothetical protein
MSRSYHVTRRSAAIKAKAGDLGSVDEHFEKSAIKDMVKRYRKTYPKARPSAKVRKLKNSFVVGVMKKVVPRERRA